MARKKVITRKDINDFSNFMAIFWPIILLLMIFF